MPTLNLAVSDKIVEAIHLLRYRLDEEKNFMLRSKMIGIISMCIEEGIDAKESVLVRYIMQWYERPINYRVLLRRYNIIVSDEIFAKANKRIYELRAYHRQEFFLATLCAGLQQRLGGSELSMF